MNNDSNDESICEVDYERRKQEWEYVVGDKELPVSVTRYEDRRGGAEQ